MDTKPDVSSLEEKIQELEDLYFGSKEVLMRLIKECLNEWYTEQKIDEELRNYSIVLFDNESSGNILARLFNVTMDGKSGRINPYTFISYAKGKVKKCKKLEEFTEIYNNQNFGGKIEANKNMRAFMRSKSIIKNVIQLKPIVKISNDLAQRISMYIKIIASSSGIYSSFGKYV